MKIFVLTLQVVFCLLVQIIAIAAAAGNMDSAMPMSNTKILEQIKKRKTLIVGIDPGFMPFDMKKPTGEIYGFDAAMMEDFAKYLGVKVKFVEAKWTSLVPSALTGKIDMIASGLTITEERKKQLLFSKPYYLEPVGALILANNESKIKNVGDLRNPNFITSVKFGTTPDLYFTAKEPKVHLIRYDTEIDAAQAVQFGKAHAFVFDQFYLRIYLQKHIDKKDKNEKNKVKILYDFLPGEELGVATHPHNLLLIEEFNTFIDTWKKSARFQDVKKYYLDDFEWLKKK